MELVCFAVFQAERPIQAQTLKQEGADSISGAEQRALCLKIQAGRPERGREHLGFVGTRTCRTCSRIYIFLMGKMETIDMLAEAVWLGQDRIFVLERQFVHSRLEAGKTGYCCKDMGKKWS